MTNKMRLYVAVETKVREFDAKLLLSCVAAEAGYDVWLGDQKIFQRQLEEFPEGIFLDKSAAPKKLDRYAHYKKLGFTIVAHDEEGLSPWRPDEYQRRRRFSDTMLEPLRYFFTWGQWQTDFVVEKAPLSRTKVLPVGHPRIDLTRKELRAFYNDDVKRLRDRYGRFVLINTNFPLFNHFSYGERMVAIKSEKDDDQREYYSALRDHQEILFAKFAEMIALIREQFPEVAVVLRPHPSENQDAWRQSLPKDERIFVIHEGNIIPWLMAAEVMVHNSCTTGIEAYLLDRPVISYRPIEDKTVESYLPNALSFEELTLDGLLNRVEQFLSNNGAALPSDNPKKQEIAARYMTGLDGLFASDRIVERLKTIQLSHNTCGIASYHLYLNIKNVTRGIVRKVIPAKPTETLKQGLQIKKYRAQKFPDMELAEVQQAISKIQQLTGRFVEVQVTQIDKKLFRISCEE